jgi:hypothetical protein
MRGNTSWCRLTLEEIATSGGEANVAVALRVASGALYAHFAASYLVPLDREVRVTFGIVGINLRRSNGWEPLIVNGPERLSGDILLSACWRVTGIDKREPTG